MVKKEIYEGNWIFKFKDNNKIAFEVTFEKYLRDSYLEAKIDWYFTQINSKDQNILELIENIPDENLLFNLIIKSIESEENIEKFIEKYKYQTKIPVEKELKEIINSYQLTIENQLQLHT